jgi:hypothetical protein
MILAANQITFMPWLGFFDLIRCADVWVTLDTFQMPDRSFIPRNKIKYSDGDIRWISIPLKAYHSNTQINKVYINKGIWWKKIINKLSNYYIKARYFKIIHHYVERLLPPREELLAEYNERTLKSVCKILDIRFSPVRLSDLEIHHESGVEATDSLLVDLCKQYRADKYYNFRRGIDEGMHKVENYLPHKIQLYKQAFEHPQYPQCSGGEFTSHMSILDALYNVGPEETRNLIVKGSGWECVQI